MIVYEAVNRFLYNDAHIQIVLIQNDFKNILEMMGNRPNEIDGNMVTAVVFQNVALCQISERFGSQFLNVEMRSIPRKESGKRCQIYVCAF